MGLLPVAMLFLRQAFDANSLTVRAVVVGKPLISKHPPWLTRAIKLYGEIPNFHTYPFDLTRFPINTIVIDIKAMALLIMCLLTMTGSPFMISLNARFPIQKRCHSLNLFRSK